MQSLYSTISLDIDSPEPVSPKTLYLLRSRLQEALDEAASVVLEDLGVINTGMHAIHVDEIEVTEVEEQEIVD